MLTCTWGGTISGNCATGSARERDHAGDRDDDRDDDRQPRAVDEDRGDHRGVRSRQPAGDGASCGATVIPARMRCCPWTTTRSPGFHPLLDDGEPLAVGAEPDAALLDLVVLADDKHVGAGLVDGDGGLRDHHDLVAALLFDDDANRLAAGENVVGIGEHRPDRLTVGSRIDLDIEKIDAALLAVERAVGQSDAGPHLAGHLGVAGFEHLALRHGEEHLHRVVLHHGREHAGIRPDQIARRDRRPPDPAGDRRLDFGVGELDLRVAQVRLGLHDRGLGLTLLGCSLVELGDRGIALAGKLGGALQLLIGIRERRLGGGELRFALIDRGFERLPLDREDHLVLP